MATIVGTPLSISYPAVDGGLELRIEAGACRLHVTPADGDAWVTGSYRDPSGSIPISSHVEGNRAWINVGRSPADIIGFLTGVPELWLELGKRRAFTITIAAGASENHLDFGGLPITRLDVNHGAGSMDVTFSTPVPVPTTRMKFAVGAGKTNVSKLGNVSFDELFVEGGAATCMLDFSGTGLKLGSVRLSTAMASVDLRVPEKLATEVTSENVLGRPKADAGFERHGDIWLNRSALANPVQLRVRSTMVMGQLALNTIR